MVLSDKSAYAGNPAPRAPGTDLDAAAPYEPSHNVATPPRSYVMAVARASRLAAGSRTRYASVILQGTATAMAISATDRRQLLEFPLDSREMRT